MVSVDAPWRMSRNGHWTSGSALVTGCGSFCVAPEKKLAILSFRDGGLDCGGAGGVAEGTDAVVVGPPSPPPLHPAASKTAARSAPHGSRSRQRVSRDTRKVPRLIANSRSPTFIANQSSLAQC